MANHAPSPETPTTPPTINAKPALIPAPQEIRIPEGAETTAGDYARAKGFARVLDSAQGWSYAGIVSWELSLTVFVHSDGRIWIYYSSRPWDSTKGRFGPWTFEEVTKEYLVRLAADYKIELPPLLSTT